MAPDMRIPAAQEGTAAGDADRGLAKSVPEGNRVRGGQGIQVRRQGAGVSHMAKDIPTPGIGDEEDEGGTLGHYRPPFAWHFALTPGPSPVWKEEHSDGRGETWERADFMSLRTFSNSED